MGSRIVAVLVLGCWAGMIFAQQPLSRYDCEANADLAAYLITISASCGYERDSKYENLLNSNSKQCIASYGEPLVANASMAGIHAVKAEMQKVGRSSVCLNAYDEYREFFK